MISEIEIICPRELYFLRPSIVDELSRIGNFSDGGYLISRSAIESTTALVSFGLGENWSFEKEFSKLNPHAFVNIYDNTVSLHFFVSNFLKGAIKFIFFQDSFSNLLTRIRKLIDYFHFWIIKSKNRHHRIHIDRKSFKIILDGNSFTQRIGLKVDIEGSEWEIVDLIAKHKDRFEFVILEVHDFERHVDQLREFLGHMSENFVLAHLHANNFSSVGAIGFPTVFELTLIRSSRNRVPTNHRAKLPIPGLDVPNAKNRPDYLINFG